MNSCGLLAAIGESKRATFEELKKELESIKRDVRIIENMEVSNEVKQPILKELHNQINEVKEQMHDYVDSL